MTEIKSERNIKLRIITAELPDTIHGFCAKLEGNDNYMVLLNSNETEDEQTAAFLHECLHIWHCDHDKQDADVSQLEFERHAELPRLLEILKRDSA